MKLKHYFLLTTLVCMAFFTSASDGMQGHVNVGYKSNDLIENALIIVPTADAKDCTVKIDVTLEDGSTIKGEVMIENITWWQCTKIQVAAWWERTF